MDIIDAIKSRRSFRAFLPKVVPQEIVRELLEVSLRAPSAINTQPWKIIAVAGEILDQIKKDNVENILSGVLPAPHPESTGVYLKRQHELGKDIFELMNIGREDREKRTEWMLRGFRYFEAPVAIILAADKSIGHNPWVLQAIGALSQTICIAALNYNLGTCIEEQGVSYPDVVKKYTGMPDDIEPIISIALGYPDLTFPANRLISRRAALDEVTTFVGF